MTIRILIADDHPVVRIGIQGVIARIADYEVIGEAVTGDEALQFVENQLPDVLILDINMPGLKAVNVVRQIEQKDLPTRVLVMTSFGDAAIVQGMLKAGATGYLLKDEGPTDVVEAIRAVAAGEIWFSPSLRPVVEAMNSAQPGFEELNEREVEVGQLVTQGLTNKEIARQTGIAERTVEFYITQMFHKLQVASRVEMALWFKEHDLFGM